MSNNTINKEEVEKFSKIAEEWWNPNGKFKPLHKFNPIRIDYIKNNIIKDFNISFPILTSSTGLSDNEILIVSPIPSKSNVPSPIEDFTLPDIKPPASVIPRCNG